MGWYLSLIHIFNSVQANTITISLQAAFGLDRFVMGCIIAALTGIVIFGGVARIAKVAEWMVPIMAGLYLLIALGVTLMNIETVSYTHLDVYKRQVLWR